MNKQLVFGHANPDTDAIGSAIAAADYFQRQGLKTEPVALGKPNDETSFALNYFKLDFPRVIEKADTSEVILVDHNEAKQSVSNINEVKVTHVIDHHKINFQTTEPLYYYAKPVGCTSTILDELYQNAQMEIPQPIAGIMLSAIISDTLLLKSPTTTAADRQAVVALAKQAGITDYQEYGLTMLKAGTNIAKHSDHEIIDGDAKSFEMNGKKVRIGQVNTVDVNDVLSRPTLKDNVKKEMLSQGFDNILLVVTNIIDSNSKGIFYGKDEAAVERAFNAKLIDHVIDLPGIVSRKKQIVPNLTKGME